MNKKLITIGIILVFLMVGLSGCNDVKNLGDVSSNPEKYLGKQVTVEGYCGSMLIMDNSGHNLYFRSNQLLTGKYRITGIVRYGEFQSGLGEVYYIDVTDAKGI